MTDSKRMFLPAPLVASLLSGATQVSVPVKPQPTNDRGQWNLNRRGYEPSFDESWIRASLHDLCPYPIGTEVWVPETWIEVYREGPCPDEACYKADVTHNEGPWLSPATMPSWAARLRYIIEEIEAGRMCDEKDQGRIPVGRLLGEGIIVSTEGRSMVDRYIARWNAAYPDYPWDSNPWRYTYTVRRL